RRRVRPDRVEGHRRRDARAPPVQPGARHLDPVRVVEADAARLGEVADLHGRVWGERSSEAELEWFYAGNPVRPASVLLAEDAGAVVGTAAMSFLRLSIGGEEVLAGMPVHLATDPAHRGRGVFRRLQAENEERAREAGARLLYVVPTP